MRVNWKRFILLMLPVRLRESKVLYTLLWSLTAYTRQKYDEEYTKIQGLIKELGFTSQTAGLLYLLRNKFNQGITIEDGTQQQLSLFWGDDDDSETFIGGSEEFFALGDEDVYDGVDFRVKVPDGVNKDDIRVFVNRYVFCGLKYEVIN